MASSSNFEQFQFLNKKSAFFSYAPKI